MAGTRRKAGLLGPQVEGYRVWLAQRGYAPSTVRNMLKDLGRVGVWLSSEGLDPSQFDRERAAAFRIARRAAGYRRIPGLRALMPLLTYLREAGIARGEQPPITPLEVLLEQYRSLAGRGTRPGRGHGAALREHRPPLPDRTRVDR